jgi:membrane glycosyltransferase
MAVRRFVCLAVALAAMAALLALMLRVLTPGGWTPVKALIGLGFLGVLPWLGLCVANALIGFAILLLTRDPPREVLPVAGDIDTAAITARTALAMTVRHEDPAAFLPPLQRLLAALAPYGDRFGGFVLSDSQNPALVAREAAALHEASGLRYRRRADNAGFKAGNVMDFLDHHADGFEFCIPLDADSQMSPEAVLRLVRIVQADPGMALVQHLTVGAPAEAAFARLFQFGMRAGMRVWATGQAWWQGREGPYWGHNAIFRVDAFRAHARLEPLPDGSPILSHDQVEAARLAGAGWGVAVWAGEDGSLEANPPALPEFLARDARWSAGNLQYRHLLTAPGFRPLGRWQLVQAILLFATAPLYPLLLVLATVNAWTDGADVPRGALVTLALAWALAIYSPKLLGYAEVLLSARERARYGGAGWFALGALSEIGFTLLLDAIAQPSKAWAMLQTLRGRQTTWLAQNRSQRGVGWREAAGLFWPHTLFGAVVFATLAQVSAWAVCLALPFAGGLLVAIPFCALTSGPRLSRALRLSRLAGTPEEWAAHRRPDATPAAPAPPRRTSVP